MGKKSVEMLVGIFVLLGMAGLVFLALKAANLGTFSGGDTYTLRAYFDNIGALKVRAPVRSAGVTVGRVASIRLDSKLYQGVVELAIERAQFSVRASKLTAAALETLAVIAYRQPVGRAEIEEIRGVSAGGVLRSLQERGLIEVVGRSEALGRPMLYGTAPMFLELLGLRDLADLPRAELLAKTGCVAAVRDISFDVGQGEVFVVMGLSGSGKSTLVRMLNRIHDPSAGEILVDGRDVMQMNADELRTVRRTPGHRPPPAPFWLKSVRTPQRTRGQPLVRG